MVPHLATGVETLGTAEAEAKAALDAGHDYILLFADAARVRLIDRGGNEGFLVNAWEDLQANGKFFRVPKG